MRAIIISIGNELLNGKTVNSNASFIGGQLYSIGIITEQVLTIRDQGEAIEQALRQALDQFDIIITTGGLGPTHDDITKKVIADFFGSPMVFNEEILHKIEERFERRGLQMPEINREQAYVPEKARLIDNPVGTAPGMHFQESGKHVFVLPGVPGEMKAMMEQSVLPFLETLSDRPPIDVHFYRTTGIAESKAYELCRSLFEAHPAYEIAFLPKFTGLDIRIAVRRDRLESSGEYQNFESALYQLIGKYIYVKGNAELEEVVGGLLRKRGLTLAVAESCSGGMIQSKITDIPGSSDYFLGGVVAYSNESKRKLLGVRGATLEKHGAVSEETAGEMAAGVLKKFGASVALSTTGIAGPGGATADKPVGLVYFGLATADEIIIRRLVFGADRLMNKERSAQAALEILRRYLLGIL